jgi:trans-aconitate methyltransferase
MADPVLSYPAWYLRHWHFLPDGYLSRPSVRTYKRIIPRLYYAAQEERVHRGLIDAIAPGRPAAILDLGCGTGELLGRLGIRFPDAQLTGIDLSPFVLEVSRRRTRRLAVRVELRHQDLAHESTALPSADVIVAAHFFGHIPAELAPGVFARAFAALNPGGTLAVLDHSWHPRFVAVRPARERTLAGGLIRLSLYQAAGA